MALDPKYNIRPTDEMFVDYVATPLTEEEATYYLKTAWIKLFGSAPSTNSLAILFAQSCLETGRWKMLRNNNWGNIKKRDGIQYTSYECSEILNGKNINFNPYNPQTFFASWPGPLEGAVGYLDFVSKKTRYQKAWEALKRGDVSSYVIELHNAGYFTADVNMYLKTTTRLYNEFLSKKDTLLAWTPPVIIEPAPEPPIEIKQEPPIIDLPEPQIPVANTPTNIKIDWITSLINFLKLIFGIKT